MSDEFVAPCIFGDRVVGRCSAPDHPARGGRRTADRGSGLVAAEPRAVRGPAAYRQLRRNTLRALQFR